jgi:pSer/pThr/pTyr-binding forkhead associated (FHA) protein
MSNELLFLRGSELLRQVALGPRAIQVGSSPDCDVALDHPLVPPRAYLIEERAGTVWLHDLCRADSEPELLPLERAVALGPYEIVRRASRAREPVSRLTQPVVKELDPIMRWTLLIGRGEGARRATIADKPFTVGSGRHNDCVLVDPTVSKRHCRFEPADGRLYVRDLGSTNGTSVQGVNVLRAELRPGSCARIGRTDIYVLGHSQRSEGRGRELVAASEAMQQVLVECHSFAPLSWPVLVLGPSGAGKEEIAHLLHRESPRRAAPFVALNAGGLPRELIESELFGHEKGAFTGAVAQRKGAFEQAHGGTLFLDEIGELPLDLQARLLRVLETWQIRRVGAEKAIEVDVRLVCATHRDLHRMVQEGSFRLDLLYRLLNAVVRVPPLCERSDDILPLAEHFLRLLAPELGPRKLTLEAKTRLLAHPWRGNARELRGVLRAAAAMAPSEYLELSDVECALRRLSGPALELWLDPDLIAQAVREHRGNVSAVSRALAIPRSTLRDHLRKRK